MTAAPKLCKDCKHFNAASSAVDCAAPQNTEYAAPDYVSGLPKGRTRPLWYGAQYCREDAKACGPEAKWWEAKP